jgi:hypothetical protein
VYTFLVAATGTWMAAALAFLLAGCNRRAEGPSLLRSPETRAEKPAQSAVPDPAPSSDATTFGDVVGGRCEVDGDCVPLSPCGLGEHDVCVAAHAAPAFVAECADPVPSTHRCVCTEGRCATSPLDPAEGK